MLGTLVLLLVFWAIHKTVAELDDSKTCKTCMYYVNDRCRRLPPTSYNCIVNCKGEIESIQTCGYPGTKSTDTCVEWSQR